MSDFQKMNLNYLLNKEYYAVSGNGPAKDRTFTHAHFGKCNDALICRKFIQGSPLPALLKDQEHFCLKTVYPGLLIGIGNTHEAGTRIGGEDAEGAEIKLGFTLDYVTGLPVIPGSTVKGVLRCAFKRYRDYVADLLRESGPEPGAQQMGDAAAQGQEDDPFIVQTEKLMEDVFEKGANKVVFFDAIPINENKV